MSYRHAQDNGMGGVEYVTIETPDEDYDHMKQEELDCEHDRTDEDGICRQCGKDCRGIS